MKAIRRRMAKIVAVKAFVLYAGETNNQSRHLTLPHMRQMHFVVVEFLLAGVRTNFVLADEQ